MTSDARHPVRLTVRNIGGIDHADLAFDRGVTILRGRNATNRTSLLSALSGALGGSTTSLKSDAEAGTVTLSIDDTEYTRTYTRRDGAVIVEGDPYTEEGQLVDHFVALFEDNPARRAVSQSGDLRDVIMAPVDTDAIEARIDDLEAKRRELEREIQELDERRRQLEDLEDRKASIQQDIAGLDDRITALRTSIREDEATVAPADATAETLQMINDHRQRLTQVENRLETKRAERDALEDEIETLETELGELAEKDESALADLEGSITSIRERSRRLDDTIASLSTLAEFNQTHLADEGIESTGGHSEPAAALAPDSDREVECWTCGTTVERAQLRDRLADLRSVIAEKRTDRDELEEQLRELEARRQSIRDAIDRRSSLERRLEEATTKRRGLEEAIDDLRDQAAGLRGEISDLEGDLGSQQPSGSELRGQYEQLGDLEFERGQLEHQLSDIERRIQSIESRQPGSLDSRLNAIESELADERRRIDSLETAAIDNFNEHMAELLDLLRYENVARVWIERKPGAGDRHATFDLHIVRETSSRTGYEDSIANLSESEREVIGLVVGLAGYLVHEAYETVPFILLDSVEAIDASRLDSLIGYLADHAVYLLAALLPEDAAEIDDAYDRVVPEAIGG